MASKTEAVSSGIGFTSLLTVLFIGLKLTGYITWSWWWVLSPLWISWVIIIAVILAFLIFLGVVAVIVHF